MACSRLLRISLLLLLLVAAACQPATTPSLDPIPLGSSLPVVVASPTLSMLTTDRMGVADAALGVSLWGNPTTTSRDLDLAQAARITWVRQDVEWRALQPDARGQFVWTEADRMVEAVHARGLKLIVRLENQPHWASASPTFPVNGPPDNPQDLADFVSALASRYAGRIAAYEVWHDPNLASHWAGRRPDAGEYVRLLRAAYSSIKASDPQALVISAGLAPTTRYDETAVQDVLYLRGMYGANLKGAFDILGVDAPGYRAQPCADPQQVAADTSLTNNDQALPIEVRRAYAFRHVEDARGVMDDRGDGNKPIAIVQAGWTTDSRAESADRWRAVSEQEQASYLVEALTCARERWSPWIGFMMLGELADPNWTVRDDRYWSSITTPDGQPRAAYTALKMRQ